MSLSKPIINSDRFNAVRLEGISHHENMMQSTQQLGFWSRIGRILSSFTDSMEGEVINIPTPIFITRGRSMWESVMSFFKKTFSQLTHFPIAIFDSIMNFVRKVYNVIIDFPSRFTNSLGQNVVIALITMIVLNVLSSWLFNSELASYVSPLVMVLTGAAMLLLSASPKAGAIITVLGTMQYAATPKNRMSIAVNIPPQNVTVSSMRNNIPRRDAHVIPQSDNPLSQLRTPLSTSEIGAKPGFTEDCKHLFYALVGGGSIATAILSGVNLWDFSTRDLNNMLNNVKNAGIAKFQWTTQIMPYFQEVWDSCMGFIFKYCFGEDALMVSDSDEVRDLLAQHSRMLSLEFRNKISKDQATAHEVVKMYRTLLSLRQKYGGNVQVRNVLNAAEPSARSLYDQVVSKNPLAQTTRMEPTCVALVGEAGVGKTLLTQEMVAPLLKLVNKFTDPTLVNGEVFVRDSIHDFWNGYRGQSIVLYDDFAQQVEHAGQPNKEWLEIVRGSNHWAYPLDMASLEAKENTYFTSDFVILTTNLKKFDPISLMQPAAFTRRIPICIDVSVIDEVRKPNGCVDPYKLKLYRDASNLPNHDTSHYVLTPIDASNFSSRQDPIQFDELIVRISESVNAKFTEYQSRKMAMESRLDYALPEGATPIPTLFGPDVLVEQQDDDPIREWSHLNITRYEKFRSYCLQHKLLFPKLCNWRAFQTWCSSQMEGTSGMIFPIVSCCEWFRNAIQDFKSRVKFARDLNIGEVYLSGSTIFLHPDASSYFSYETGEIMVTQDTEEGFAEELFAAKHFGIPMNIIASLETRMIIWEKWHAFEKTLQSIWESSKLLLQIAGMVSGITFATLLAGGAISYVANAYGTNEMDLHHGRAQVLVTKMCSAFEYNWLEILLPCALPTEGVSLQVTEEIFLSVFNRVRETQRKAIEIVGAKVESMEVLDEKMRKIVRMFEEFNIPSLNLTIDQLEESEEFLESYGYWYDVFKEQEADMERNFSFLDTLKIAIRAPKTVLRTVFNESIDYDPVQNRITKLQARRKVRQESADYDPINTRITRMQRRRHVQREEVSSVKEVVRKVLVQPQSAPSKQGEELLHKLARNNVNVEIAITRGSTLIEKRIGLAFSPGGRLLFMNRHYWFKILNSIEDTDSKVSLRFANPQHGGYVAFELQEIVKTYKHYTIKGEKTDFITITLPKSFGALPDILKHVISRKHSEDIYPGTEIALRTWTQKEKHFVPLIRYGKFTGFRSCSMEVGNADNGELCIFNNVGETNIGTLPGDCGSAYILQDDKFTRKLCGLHFAGVPNGGSVFMPLYLEDLAPLMRDQNAAEDVIDRVMAQGFDAMQCDEEDMSKLPGNFAFHCKINEQIYNPLTSKWTESLIYEQVAPTKVAPSSLAPALQINGPMLQGIAKNAGNVEAISTEIVNRCIEDYKRLIGRLPPSSAHRRVFSYEEALKGLQGDDSFAPINRVKSPGFPYMTQTYRTHNRISTNKGKQYWLGENKWLEAGDVGWDQLKKDCDALEETAKTHVPSVIFVDTLKDEKRPIEKVILGKTRTFAAAPQHYSIVFRKYFGGFLSFMYNKRISAESCVGVCDKTEWSRIAEYLNAFGNGENKIAGDFENFDGSVTSHIFSRIVEIINWWYGGTKMESRIRENLWSAISSSQHLVGNLIYQWSHGQPSGNPSTAISNSIYNSLVVRYVMYTCCPVDLYEDLNPNAVMRMVAYGDDNILALRNDVTHWFTPEKIQKGFESIGMRYTSETKGDDLYYKALKDVSFLKRQFVYCPIMNKYIAPLKLDSILEMTNWISTGLNREMATVLNCETAIRELYYHSEDTFEEVTTKIQNALVQKGCPIVTHLTWQQAREMMAAGEISEVLSSITSERI